MQYIALTNPPNYINEITFELGQSLATKLTVALGYNLKINIETYFKKLTIELHVLYALNTHVNFVSIGYISHMIYKFIFHA